MERYVSPVKGSIGDWLHNEGLLIAGAMLRTRRYRMSPTGAHFGVILWSLFYLKYRSDGTQAVDKVQTCILDGTVIHEGAVELLPLPSWERAGVRVR